MDRILSIGLPHDWVNGINVQPQVHVHPCDTLDQALALLDRLDFCCVILDLHQDGLDRGAISTLMSRTPLTTRFVVVCHKQDAAQAHELEQIGVKTMQIPVGVDELIAEMHP